MEDKAIPAICMRLNQQQADKRKSTNLIFLPFAA
jgi:hypothetical protein